MLNTNVHVLYSSVSLFVFKMETPNSISSPADSVFKVSEKNGPNQILKSSLNLCMKIYWCEIAKSAVQNPIKTHQGLE